MDQKLTALRLLADGLSAKDVSAQLGVPVVTLHSWSSRARRGQGEMGRVMRDAGAHKTLLLTAAEAQTLVHMLKDAVSRISFDGDQAMKGRLAVMALKLLD